LNRCYRWEGGRKRERCGVMGVVERGGELTAGMTVLVEEAVDGWRDMVCV